MQIDNNRIIATETQRNVFPVYDLCDILAGDIESLNV